MEKSKPVMVTTIATINNQQIVVIENGEKRVAVKPICQALGVNYTTQVKRLENDPILGSTTIPLRGMVGADGKDREMITIPFKFVFGWLFRIDSRNVKDSARDTVLKYQLECYMALYAHFTEMDDYLKYRNALAELAWDQVEAARNDFKLAKTKLENLKKEFAEARAFSFEDYRKHKAQLTLEFPATKKGGGDEEADS